MLEWWTTRPQGTVTVNFLRPEIKPFDVQYNRAQASKLPISDLQNASLGGTRPFRFHLHTQTLEEYAQDREEAGDEGEAEVFCFDVVYYLNRLAAPKGATWTYHIVYWTFPTYECSFTLPFNEGTVRVWSKDGPRLYVSMRMANAGKDYTHPNLMIDCEPTYVIGMGVIDLSHFVCPSTVRLCVHLSPARLAMPDSKWWWTWTKGFDGLSTNDKTALLSQNMNPVQ